MATNPNSPLNDTHLAQIQNALKTISVIESQILMAKQAKIDVSAQEAQLAASKEKLQLLRQVYFPNAT